MLVLLALLFGATIAQQQYQYTETVGACRGGASPANYAGMKNFRDRNCEARCNQEATCTGYVKPKSNAKWCETYTSQGARGDGRKQFGCYMKGAVAPGPASYERTEGACRGGASPANNAGRAFFRDRNCEARCNLAATCTGYVLSKSNNANWCETYTSKGATGDGRTLFWCYMKKAAPNTCCKEWTAACYTDGGEASCASKEQCEEACATPRSLNCMSCCSLQMTGWNCPEGGPTAVCRAYDKRQCNPKREIRQRSTLPECYYNLAKGRCDVKYNACTPLRNKECKETDGCRVQREIGEVNCVVDTAPPKKECAEIQRKRHCAARSGECAWVPKTDKCVESEHGCPSLRQRKCKQNAKCIFTNRECKDKEM